MPIAVPKPESPTREAAGSVVYRREPRASNDDAIDNAPASASPSDGSNEIELGIRGAVPNDPLSLTKAKVKPEVLDELRRRGSTGKKLVQFYEQQNELIDNLLKAPDHRDANEEAQLFKLKIAINGSFAANVLLFILQLSGAILSGSLSLLATTADAFMDIASGGVLLFASYIAKSATSHKYPTGKSRFETAGIIVFSTLMATLSLQLIIEGLRSLSNPDRQIELGPLSIAFVCSAVGIKFCLFLFCSTLSKYPTARILAQDHRNDLALNITGIAFGILGERVKWWLDPFGGILIAILILRSWSSTADEHIKLIVGMSADVNFLQRLTYITIMHDERIRQVDTCRAYHAGSKFVVEVDIVLPPDMPLGEAHDIGEALQVKLETIEEVERAYVHLDYETSHKVSPGCFGCFAHQHLFV
ncbi:cation efflux family-domain-containing protein [Entophlyctis helioformis]|nr:cation efflux family-domain-containing protein [Entophlyctis helioformis]